MSAWPRSVLQASMRWLAPTRRLLRFVANRFDVVSVRIEDEGTVVGRVILGAQAWRTIVPALGGCGFLVKGIDHRAIVAGEGDVQRRAGRALLDPEVRFARAPEA